MEIEQLTIFLKVAETENITRAAELIGLSQPAVSRSLQRLEEELGQPLFERQSRRMALTDAGTTLLRRARQILSLVDDVKMEISDDGESGRIRLAAIPTIAPYFLPRLLSDFAAKFPKAKLTVQEDTTQNLLTKLTQGEVDIAILALPITAKYLDVESLFEEELYLVLPNGHELCEKKQLEISDIESLPFVLLGETHCLTDNIESYCRQQSFHPVSVERTSQLATVQELVSLGHGVSMIPAMARDLDESERRTYRSFSGTKPMRTIAVAWNPYRFQSKLALAFLGVLRGYGRQSPSYDRYEKTVASATGLSD